jgi:hypothetical protein
MSTSRKARTGRSEHLPLHEDPRSKNKESMPIHKGGGDIQWPNLTVYAVQLNFHLDGRYQRQWSVLLDTLPPEHELRVLQAA